MKSLYKVSIALTVAVTHLFAQPTITSFTPTNGSIGTIVTIIGTNFSSTASNNFVYFGAVRAVVNSASSTSLNVTVPVGATYAPITVTVNGLTAYSPSPFIVTFPGGGTIDASSFASKVDFTTGSNPYGVTISDVDEDGKPDLAATNFVGNTVSVFRNTSAPGSIAASSFASNIDFATGSLPYGVATSDVDGDGKPDLVVANENSLTVSVLRNTTGDIAQAQNNSALFDGTTSRIRVVEAGPINRAANPDAFKISGTSITVEAWVYPVLFPSPNLGNPIVTRPLNQTVPHDESYGLSIYNGNGFPQARFAIANGSPGTTTAALSPESLPTFQWTHLAGTYDGTMLRLYVNGLLKVENSTTISINSSNGVGFYIGRFLNNAFQGAIDEVRLWNVARTQPEIQGSMNIELTGSELGLAGYWNVNNFLVTDGITYFVSGRLVMPDKTVNHNDLVVQGQTPLIPFNPFQAQGTTTFTALPSQLDFGILEQGSNGTQALSITNTGAFSLIGSLAPVSNTIEITSGGVFFASPGQTSNATITARPLVAGAVATSITTHTNAVSGVQIAVSMTSIALRRLDANNIGMWTQRDGRFARDPITLNAGFEWLKGSGKTPVFASGIWIAAKVNTEIRTAAASYFTNFQPGPVINGVAVNPNDVRYRVYKIQMGDNAATNPDYAEWPADLGAPVNNDGTPKFIGDQTLFAVYNDLDPLKHTFVGEGQQGIGTLPLGAEVQQTTFGFNQSGARSNTVFLRFRIINRSSLTWKDTYVSLWSDPDLGNWADDFIGIDVQRDLGFVYNATNSDTVYGTPPPAAGYDILKGAFFTKPIQGFAFFNPGAAGPSTITQMYNFMQGLRRDGLPFIDPTTGTSTAFPLNGDPVTGSGWIDSNPGDRRFLFSTGPFDLEPGQSKEMIAAIVVGQGTSNLNSVTALRAASDEIQTLFDGGQIFGGAVENVTAATVPAGNTTTVNDLSHSGAQLELTAGTGGATIEVASYVDPPPGAQDITAPSFGGVGKYLEVQVQGNIAWPVQLKIYYTANDLAQAGVVEDDLQGLYYWSGTANQWKLYSNSGLDDQDRGVSTTAVNAANVVLNGVQYEGYVFATTYHLTPIVVGAKKKTITQRYDETVQYVQSLPDAAFKNPAAKRRFKLADKLGMSKSMFLSGNIKAAVQKLQKDILNHLTPQGNSSQDLWVVDDAARAKLLRMVNDLIDLLQRPESTAKMAGAGISVFAMDEELPTEYGMSQNYPNPFNPSTIISYSLPKAANVSLRVFNTLGQEVAVLVNEQRSPGYYHVQWNANVPSGIYFYRLQAGEFIETKRLVLLK